MSRYKAYSDTKPSAISWLDSIPDWWDEKRLKYLFIQQSRPVREDDAIVTCFRDGQVTLRSNRRTEGFTNALKEHGYQGVRTGDLVIHSMDAFAGAIGVSDSDGKMSPVCTIALPTRNGIMTRFYAYMIRAMAITGFIESLAKGIRERSTDFRWGEAREVVLPVPTDTEQSQIATFLDRETTRIDTLIEKKQRFIELLEEKRQAVITHAVTKGLDPNAPMKDSGVEWIGEVPAHWEVKRLKNSVSSCRNGIWGSDALGDGNDIPCVRVADFCRDSLTIELDSPTLRSLTPTERGNRVLKRGDLVLEKSGGGEKQPVGAVMLYDHDAEAVCSNFTARMVLKDGMSPSFWRYAHAAGYANQLNVPSIKQTSGIQNLDQHSYLNEQFSFPDSDEQSQIATFLDRETTRIDTLIDKTRESIELLKERRSALITAAVTGKIDVREEAA